MSSSFGNSVINENAVDWYKFGVLRFMNFILSPLQFITDKIKWKIDTSYGTQGTLEDFFG